MMSIYTEDAVLTDSAHDDKVIACETEVRRCWANVSGRPRAEHHWIRYTPAMRMHAEAAETVGKAAAGAQEDAWYEKIFDQ